MGVIGGLELVLDDDNRAVGHVAADEVQREPTNRVLRLGQLQLDPEGFSQAFGIVEQPRVKCNASCGHMVREST